MFSLFDYGASDFVQHTRYEKEKNNKAMLLINNYIILLNSLLVLMKKYHKLFRISNETSVSIHLYYLISVLSFL